MLLIGLLKMWGYLIGLSVVVAAYWLEREVACWLQVNGKRTFEEKFCHDCCIMFARKVVLVAPFAWCGRLAVLVRLDTEGLVHGC